LPAPAGRGDVKVRAKESTANNISLSLGEYLEDYGDPSTWDTQGLSKWAMSAFRVNLSPGRIKQQSPEEIEEQLIAAAAEQIDKKDYSPLIEFLKDDFAVAVRLGRQKRPPARRGTAQELKPSRRAMVAGDARGGRRDRVPCRVRRAWPTDSRQRLWIRGVGEWANRKYNAGLRRADSERQAEIYNQPLQPGEFQ
jgi:hypothetical protein